MKRAIIIIPLFKEKGEPTEFGNYRPISLLNVISKIFERVVYNQLYEYFTLNNLFYNSQYGFRTKHSTEDATIELIDRIQKVFENNPFEQVLSVFLDLSKAFDTIDHHILLEKLSHYRIDGVALRWFQSYLSNRKQFITLEGVESDNMDISVGVPQGSILGPLIFLIYINDAHRASQALNFIHFADDTTLSQNLAFFSGGNLTRSQMERRINAELSNVYDWLCVNKLSLNVSKSRCMIFKNRKIDTVSRPWNIEINGEKVECVPEFNFLGILLDEFLTWTPHTKKICSKISRTLGVIKRARRTLPFPALKSLYNALIVPHLNYGIKLWHPNSHSVNVMQKRAIRVITSKKFFHHTSGLFKEHNLLKLDDIHKLQCLKMYFKIENNMCSNHTRSLIVHNRNIHDYNTRGRNDVRPTTMTRATWLRHSLPKIIQDTPNHLLNFDCSIKTFSRLLNNFFISSYETECTLEHCLPCGRQARD